VGRDVNDARGADTLDGGFESAVAGVKRGLPAGLAEELVNGGDFGLGAGEAAGGAHR